MERKNKMGTIVIEYVVRNEIVVITLSRFIYLSVIKLNGASKAKRPGRTFDGKVDFLILGGVHVKVRPR